MKSQEEGLLYRIEMYEERIRNTKENTKRFSDPLKIQVCRARIAKLQSEAIPRQRYWKIYHRRLIQRSRK